MVKSPSPNYFDVGSAIHCGLAHSGMQRNEEQATEAALVYYQRCPHFTKRHPSEAAQSLLLIEAIIRSWYCNGHNFFHNMYKVLHVEEESYMQTPSPDGQFLLHWESRADAIVQERNGTSVAAISYKTADAATEFRKAVFRTDLQGLFEAWFGSRLLSQRSNLSLRNSKVDYIQTIIFEKGTLGDPNIQYSPEAAEVAFERPTNSKLIQTYCVDPHGESQPFFNEIPGLVNNHCWSVQYWKPGNKSYNRLSGMIRRLLTQGEIAGWIHSLAEDKIFPTAEYNQGLQVLDTVVHWEPAIMRSDIDAESVIAQTYYQQARYAAAAEAAFQAAESGNGSEYFRILDEWFPQHVKSCKAVGMSTCQFVDLCFDQRPNGLMIPERYERRIPHHENERKALYGY